MENQEIRQHLEPFKELHSVCPGQFEAVRNNTWMQSLKDRARYKEA